MALDKLGLYDVAFDDDCRLTISHEHDVVFSANMSEFVHAGQGTADSKASNIVKDGNLAHLPLVTEESLPVDCPSMSKEDGALIFDGQIDVPLRQSKQGHEGKKIEYKRVNTLT